jgi:hypothetical protein
VCVCVCLRGGGGGREPAPPHLSHGRWPKRGGARGRDPSNSPRLHAAVVVRPVAAVVEGEAAGVQANVVQQAQVRERPATRPRPGLAAARRLRRWRRAREQRRHLRRRDRRRSHGLLDRLGRLLHRGVAGLRRRSERHRTRDLGYRGRARRGSSRGGIDGGGGGSVRAQQVVGRTRGRRWAALACDWPQRRMARPPLVGRSRGRRSGPPCCSLPRHRRVARVTVRGSFDCGAADGKRQCWPSAQRRPRQRSTEGAVVGRRHARDAASHGRFVVVVVRPGLEPALRGASSGCGRGLVVISRAHPRPQVALPRGGRQRGDRRRDRGSRSSGGGRGGGEGGEGGRRALRRAVRRGLRLLLDGRARDTGRCWRSQRLQDCIDVRCDGRLCAAAAAARIGRRRALRSRPRGRRERRRGWRDAVVNDGFGGVLWA